MKTISIQERTLSDSKKAVIFSNYMKESKATAYALPFFGKNDCINVAIIEKNNFTVDLILTTSELWQPTMPNTIKLIKSLNTYKKTAQPMIKTLATAFIPTAYTYADIENEYNKPENHPYGIKKQGLKNRGIIFEDIVADTLQGGRNSKQNMSHKDGGDVRAVVNGISYDIQVKYLRATIGKPHEKH